VSLILAPEKRQKRMAFSHLSIFITGNTIPMAVSDVLARRIWNKSIQTHSME
jgi:hypothetical protein